MSDKMVLIDTAIWADHIDHTDDLLSKLLNEGRVLMHPFVLGELALGNLKPRIKILQDLQDLPRVVVASEGEVLHFIEQRKSFGRGIGYVDVHLLAAVQLSAGATLWTSDRRLRTAAEELKMDFKGKLMM